MAFGLPGGGFNTYIPALVDNLVTSFSRNAKDFGVNMICRPRPVKKPTGYYQFFNPLDYQRFPNGSTNPSDPLKWAPNALRPMSGGPELGYEYRTFTCVRYTDAKPLDMLADQVADFPFLKGETENSAAKIMVSRTAEVINIITDAANYPSTNTDTATNWGGGFWNAGTETNPIIKKSLLNIGSVLARVTNGNITLSDLVLVVNPVSAYKMATSQEIHSIFARSPYAADLLTKETTVGGGSNGPSFGLPANLYGVRTVVLDTSANWFNRSASGEARSFLYPDNQATLLCVKGRGDASEAGTSLDTVQMFLFEDMTVEAESDTFNRIIKIATTDNRQAVQVAGTTGANITNLFS